MKFTTLEVQNFLTIKEAKVNLADRGLQLIQGINADDSSASSNGAGKSSLVDAICWCLFGVTARDVKGDAVVNLAAKKDCRVRLELQNGSDHYMVVRHRKHTGGKNTLVVAAVNGATVTDLSRGTDAETQKVLEKILGCSFEVFMAAVYSGQEAMPDLPKMKDRELKTLIEEAAGLQRIERAYELARERANAIKAEVGIATLDLDTTRANMHTVKENLDAIIAQSEAWEEQRSARVEESQDALAAAQKAVEDASLVMTKMAPAAVDAHARLTDIDATLANHKTLEAAAQAAEAEVRRAELAIDANLLKRLAAEITRIEAQITNAATEIKKPCSECGTVLETMSIADFIAHRTEHLDAAKKKLEDAKVTARAQLDAVLKARASAAAARAAVPDVTALVAERHSHAEIKRQYDEAKTQVNRANLNLDAARTQLELRRTEANPYTENVARAHKAVTAGAAAMGAATTRLETLSKKQEVAAAVVKVYGPAGVRAQILDTVTPFLNARTSDYLSALSDGEITAVWTTLTKDSKGELKEKFSLDVTHAKGGDSFSALSGGEKRKVRLATALALQDLVASRASQPLDIWIGDEVDDALDPAGLERLMTILERKARERGTVLVISHSDLRDWIDNVTTVRKGEQWTSTVEGSLCS